MNRAPFALPSWQCHKIVGAARIAQIAYVPASEDAAGDSIGASLLLDIPVLPYVSDPIPFTRDWLAKHEPVEGGYLVEYEDGYTSYSPAGPFEKGYRPYGPDEAVDTLRGGSTGSSCCGQSDEERETWVRQRAVEMAISAASHIRTANGDAAAEIMAFAQKIADFTAPAVTIYVAGNHVTNVKPAD